MPTTWFYHLVPYENCSNAFRIQLPSQELLSTPPEAAGLGKVVSPEVVDQKSSHDARSVVRSPRAVVVQNVEVDSPWTVAESLREFCQLRRKLESSKVFCGDSSSIESSKEVWSVVQKNLFATPETRVIKALPKSLAVLESCGKLGVSFETRLADAEDVRVANLEALSEKVLHQKNAWRKSEFRARPAPGEGREGGEDVFNIPFLERLAVTTQKRNLRLKKLQAEDEKNRNAWRKKKTPNNRLVVGGAVR